MTVPILIDCDPGHDDAIALLLALASPEIELRAVTTVAGNTTLEKTTANAIRVLDLAGSAIPVAAGCDRPLVRDLVVAEHVHGVSGLDGPVLRTPTRPAEPMHAVELMAATVEAADEPIVLVPVGPLTNVALFLIRYPELAARLARIVLMGGTMGMGNITPAAEFNIYADPEAAARVFRAPVPVTMIGLDVTHQALLRARDASRLAAAGVAGRFVADLLAFFSRREPGGPALDGAPIHDAVAVAHLIWPDLVETEARPVTIELGEAQRGRTIVDRRLGRPEEGAVRVATAIDGPRFTRLLVERLEALA